MMTAPILVLIVNYRTAALTVKAIEAIMPEIEARDDAHVLVVDNGSADGSAGFIAQAIKRHGWAGLCSLLALDTNLGFAAGNNAGLEHYRQLADETFGRRWPTLTWLLNPDTIAAANALGILVDFLKAHPEAGLAGGRCLRPDGTVRHSAFRFHSLFSEFLTTLDFGPLRSLLSGYDVLFPLSEMPFRAEWLSGAHLMIRNEVFERIGLFDPSYFLFYEETDFCERAASAGFEAWQVPASRVMHIGGAATGLVEERPPERAPGYWFASRARFLLRRHGLAQTHFANLLWLVAAPVGALLARVRGRPRHDPPRIWRDFLVHNYGRGGLMYQARKLSA